MRGYEVVGWYPTAEPELGESFVAWRVVGGARREQVALRRFREDTDDVLAALGRADRLAEAYDPGLPPIVEVLRRPELAIVTTLLSGETAADALAAQGRLGAAQAAAVCARVAEILAFCHDLLGTPEAGGGMFHGGVGPGAIALTGGEAQLLDLALGPLREAQAREAEGWVPPPWMAPEQVHGVTDALTDVHGLGLALYELVVGAPPWDLSGADTPEDWLKRRRALGLGAALARLDAAAPELVSIVDRCLQVDRADRYASAGQLAEALRAAREALRTRVGSAPQQGATPGTPERVGVDKGLSPSGRPLARVGATLPGAARPQRETGAPFVPFTIVVEP